MESRTLATYLKQKAQSLQEAATRRSSGEDWRDSIEETCVANDATGVRKLRIGNWEAISDSGRDFGGWNLGPSSPELLCGVISTCLTHTYLIAAATTNVPLERVEVKVTANNNDARFLGIETSDPTKPFDMTAHVRVEAGEATEAQIESLHGYVEERCPLTQLIREPGEIHFVREDGDRGEPSS